MRYMHRVAHLLVNLGWVDFDLGYSTILPSCSASSANFPSAQAEGGTAKIKVNSTQVCQEMGHLYSTYINFLAYLHILVMINLSANHWC